MMSGVFRVHQNVFLRGFFYMQETATIAQSYMLFIVYMVKCNVEAYRMTRKNTNDVFS